MGEGPISVIDIIEEENIGENFIRYESLIKETLNIYSILTNIAPNCEELKYFRKDRLYETITPEFDPKYKNEFWEKFAPNPDGRITNSIKALTNYHNTLIDKILETLPPAWPQHPFEKF